MSMKKNNMNKKIIHSLIAIILTIVIFIVIAFVNNINTPDRWIVKYKIIISEKATIYLNNLDTMMQELKIKTKEDIGLKSHVDKLIKTKIEGMPQNYISKIKVQPNFIVFESSNIENSSNDISELIKTLNEEIKNNLFIKLNLYENVANERIKEKNEYLMSQIEKITLIEDKNNLLDVNESFDLTLEYYVNYIKTNLSGMGQEMSIESLQEIFNNLNNDISQRQKKEYLLGLRKVYASITINNNIKLYQLKKRSRNLSNIEIIEDGYILNSTIVSSALTQKLLIAAILGLIISLIGSYLYLAFSTKLLKKKLAFLLYPVK